MPIWIFPFTIIFFPFIIAILVFGAEYMYIPQLRIGLIIVISLIYLWFTTYRKKYSDRHNGYFKDTNLMSEMSDGITYFYTIGHNKDNTVTTLNMSIEDIYGYDFSFKFETRFEQFFKSFGLSTECQSGDIRFDKNIYIISDDKWLCTQLKEKSTLRDSLYSLFWSHYNKGIKVQKVVCFNGRLTLEAKNETSHFSDNDAKVFFKKMVPLMKEAIVHLPSKATSQDPIYREHSGRIAFVFHTLIIALLVNGAIMLYFEYNNYMTFPQLSDSYSILPLSFAVTAVTLVTIILIIFRYLRKSSRFSPVLFELFTLGTLGIFLSSLVEIKDINVYLDNSNATSFTSSISSKEKHSGRKRITTYFLNLQGWNNHPGQHRLQVDSEIYDRIQENQPIVVYLREGFLGYAWIEKIGWVDRVQTP